MKKSIYILFSLLFIILLCSCNYRKRKKLPQVSERASAKNDSFNVYNIEGFPADYSAIETQPRNVLPTQNSSHRLVPIFKVNYQKKNKKYPYLGDVHYFKNLNYWDDYWTGNFMPGIRALTGDNMVNIAHHNKEKSEQKYLFEKPVLIETLYYPSTIRDTINSKPTDRDYYMVSAYDEDTNQDGFINKKDLRRFYLFDIDGDNQKELVPKNYSVMSCTYDKNNDYMFVYAKEDTNNNGQMEVEEPTHIFGVDLKNPDKEEIVYQND